MPRATPAAPTLSVSIVVYKSDPEVLQHTLASLFSAIDCAIEQQLLSRAAVQIVCNDDSADVLRSRLPSLSSRPWVSLVVTSASRNIGYGAAHNLAIAAADSHWHLILNPDVTLAPDCLVAGLQYLGDHPRITAVSPHASDGTGARQFLCKRFPAVLDLALRGFAPRWLRARFEERLTHYEMQDLVDGVPACNIPIISGCFMLYRTADLKRLRGFDPGYFLYFEDFDLSLRTGQTGSLAYVPAMKIVHLGGHASRKGLRHILYFARSALRFYRGWGWRWR